MMPGRLLPNFVRTSSLPSSSSTSLDSPRSAPTSPKPSQRSLTPTRAEEGPERRLSFSMDNLIHPHRTSKDKRRSFPRSKSGERSSSLERKAASANLDIIIESPPLVFYGTPAHSTGALLSGRLRLAVGGVPGEITLRTFRMRLVKTSTNKKPVSRDCPGCASRTEELSKWEFLTEPVSLKRGTHDFPFSYLFPGSLPASIQGSLGSIDYHLSATAVTSTGEELRLRTPLKISRAILPGHDKSSIRIFPPTNLTGRITLPSVVHPIGTFPVKMSLSGVLENREASHTRWRLRKAMWRIEEHQKMASTACPKHAHKVGGEGKGILHQDTRIIGHDEEKGGWKSDFDTAGGEITLEFEAGIKPGSNPICDLSAKTENDLEVKHHLVIELIVAEEFCPISASKPATPTGAARILRMLFHLNVTERSGLGISWDEEMPPVYSDVPASPPGYARGDRPGSCMEDLPLPEYEELERMERVRSSATAAGRDPAVDRAESEFTELSLSQSRPKHRLTTDDLEAEPQFNDPRAHREGDEEAPPDMARGAVRPSSD